MNYPIFNLDYKYTLEEVVRYLKFFNNHLVYLSVPLDFYKRELLESQHQFKEDGLLIRLYWKPRTTDIKTGFMNVKGLFSSHKKGNFKLVGYDFIRFSSNQVSIPKSGDTDSSEIFFNKVMRNRPKDQYTVSEYQLMEHKLTNSTMLPDILFDLLVQEENNRMAFEKYYEERQNETGTQHKVENN